MSHRDIVEVEEPNLLEDLFPHEDVPRIAFDSKIYEEINGEVIEFDPQEALKREWLITDTTFRDGQQARPPYTVQQIVDLYNLLSKMSGPFQTSQRYAAIRNGDVDIFFRLPHFSQAKDGPA